MQSDALRPFILHAFGADLALMAEEPELINNAQMASVPGHPLWRGVMRLLATNAAAGLRDPLYATGPRVVTAAFRVGLLGGTDSQHDHGYGSRDAPDVDPLKLGATAPDPSSGPPSAAVVFGPRQWFHPCAWNDEGCHRGVSRVTPLLRLEPAEARQRAAALDAAGATEAAEASEVDRPTGAGDAAMAMVYGVAAAVVGADGASGEVHGPGGGGGGGSESRRRNADGNADADGDGRGGGDWAAALAGLDVIGVHHFSGSWLGFDGSKAERSRGWAERTGQRPQEEARRAVDSKVAYAAAEEAVEEAEPAKEADAAESCVVVSVRQRWPPATWDTGPTAVLGPLEEALVREVGCTVHVLLPAAEGPAGGVWDQQRPEAAAPA
ncbi:hypothetical protein GPECTOR_2g1378 [Gonium pectorale]|uniref:Uncharacterized protein n=1 Tax=Gonium pectorale TaxID=33097 RepID=A0A150H0Y7_GONPE|nr:hypothetical protein GPECTOR_2g1378 [Gonium pectorale]|eukprot:KXZ55827.1 hypothetical protein GPECTOR_2g1378 [Gonium pectorale]